MTVKCILHVKGERTAPTPAPARRLTLEMVMLGWPATPDKSASSLNMSVRPMWDRISSKLYVPEMENLGKCKSSRLERESDREGLLSHYPRSCRWHWWPELWGEERFPRVRGTSLPMILPALPEHSTAQTFRNPFCPDFTDIL